MLKENCWTLNAQIEAGLYMIVGADVGGSVSFNICNCCNSDTGEIIKNGSIYGEIAAYAHIGFGLGLEIPFMPSAVVKGPTIGVQLPLSGGIDCDGKGYASFGVSVPISLGGELIFSYGVNVGGSIGIKGNFGAEVKVTRTRTSLNFISSASGEISVSGGAWIINVGHTWRIPFGEDSKEFGFDY